MNSKWSLGGGFGSRGCVVSSVHSSGGHSSPPRAADRKPDRTLPSCTPAPARRSSNGQDSDWSDAGYSGRLQTATTRRLQLYSGRSELAAVPDWPY